MSMGQPKTQPAIQAGSSGKAAAVGSEVGGVHSSPIGRRDAACSHASLRGAGAGNGSKEIITPQCFGSPDARSTARPRLQPNASRRSDSESRIREIRPSGLMRGRSLTVIGASLSTRRLRPTLLRSLAELRHRSIWTFAPGAEAARLPSVHRYAVVIRYASGGNLSCGGVRIAQ